MGFEHTSEMGLTAKSGLSGKFTKTQIFLAQLLATEVDFSPASVFPDRRAKVTVKGPCHVANVNSSFNRQRFQIRQTGEVAIDAITEFLKPKRRALVDGGGALHFACEFHDEGFEG